MPTPTDVPALLRAYLRRYHQALFLKALVWAAAASLLAGLLAWRLALLGVAPAWRGAVVLALLVAPLGTIGWWLARAWISERDGAVLLDRALGLHERLLTAQEFAAAPTPPPLYSLLLEDAARHLGDPRLPLPRPVDRATGVLVALLLVLLLWPRAQHPLQLAQRPVTPPTTHPPQPEPTPASGASQSSVSGGEGAGSEPQGQGRQQAAGEAQHGASRDTTSGKTSEAAGARGQQGGEREADAGARSRGAQAHGRERSPAGQSPERVPPSAGRVEGSSSSEESRTAQPQVREGMGAGQAQQREGAGREAADHAAQQAGSRGSDSRGQRSGTSESSAGGQQDAARGSQAARAAAERQGGGGGSMADPAAMKADIQQLLQEVSGELETLQRQLAKEQVPTPGTLGDPTLYESGTAVDPSASGTVPVELTTDRAAASRPRGGTGVADASAKAARTAPMVTPEAAQLTDTPQDEPGINRQPVPLEYKDAFDRLNRKGQ